MAHDDIEQDLQQRLALAGSALFVVVCSGVIGYSIFAPDSSLLDRVYMTVITLTTVGYGEVISTTGAPALKIFTMFLMVFGMGLLLFSVTTITASLIEFDLMHVFRRRRMERQIAALENHFIVCGAGDTGCHVIEELAATRVPYVVIEESAERCDSMRERTPELLYLVGDATDEELLTRAGIVQARGLCAALSNDKDNLYLTLTARSLNARVRIVARGVSDQVVAKLERAGANTVVSPTAIGGLRLASELVRPHTVSFLDLMLRDVGESHRFGELPIAAGGPWVGKQIRELPLRQQHVLVVAVREPGGAFRYAPPDEYAVAAESVLIVLGSTATVARVRAEIVGRPTV